jgi:hypothetical protein
VVAAGLASVLAISGVGFSPAVRYFCHVRLQDGVAGELRVTLMLIVAIMTSAWMCDAMSWRESCLIAAMKPNVGYDTCHPASSSFSIEASFIDHTALRCSIPPWRTPSSGNASVTITRHVPSDVVEGPVITLTLLPQQLPLPPPQLSPLPHNSFAPPPCIPPPTLPSLSPILVAPPCLPFSVSFSIAAARSSALYACRFLWLPPPSPSSLPPSVKMAWSHAATAAISSLIPRNTSFTRAHHLTSAVAASAIAVSLSSPSIGSSLGTITCSTGTPAPPDAAAAIVSVVMLVAHDDANVADDELGQLGGGVTASQQQYEVSALGRIVPQHITFCAACVARRVFYAALFRFVLSCAGPGLRLCCRRCAAQQDGMTAG